MKRHTSFCVVLVLLCLAGAAWSAEAPATSAAAAPQPTTLSAPTLPWLSPVAPTTAAPGLSRSTLSPAPTQIFYSGFCTLDCSYCESYLDCFSRHAGGCTEVPAC